MEWILIVEHGEWVECSSIRGAYSLRRDFVLSECSISERTWAQLCDASVPFSRKEIQICA